MLHKGEFAGRLLVPLATSVIAAAVGILHPDHANADVRESASRPGEPLARPGWRCCMTSAPPPTRPCAPEFRTVFDNGARGGKTVSMCLRAS